MTEETLPTQPAFYQKESAYIRPVDTTGLVFMSIFAIILLFSLLRSEQRYRKLLAKLGGVEV